MMANNIVIVGAGGFALELLGYLEHEQANGRYTEYHLKGVVDDSVENFDKFVNIYDLPYLGTVTDYKPSTGDVFWIAIGSQPSRRNVIELLKEKNASFFTFVSSLSIVNRTSEIGVGSIVAPFCIVNANVSLGDFALMNSYSAIGHDSTVGTHAILYPYAAINGSCRVGSELIMGTRATIFPGTKVGSRCVVTTHSYIKNDKPDDRFIHLKAKEIDLENRL